MGGVTAVSRLVGFVRVLVIAAVLGTTYLGNTFQASNSVSNVLFELLAAGALSAVLVPTFVTLDRRAATTREADRLANGLLGYALVVLGVITVLGIVFAPLLARLLSSGAPNAHVGAEQRHLATFLLVVLRAAGRALRVRRDRDRSALREAALRDHRGRADRQQRRDDRCASSCSACWPGRTRRFDLTARREGCCSRSRAPAACSRSSAILVVAARRAGLLAAARAGTAAIPRSSRFSRLAVWGVLLHSGAAMLLGAAIVVGNGVAGGVVAYQVAFVFFLAPYAVLAQPIHTAILPEMSNDAAAGDLDAFARLDPLGARPHGAARDPGVGRDWSCSRSR